MERPTQWGTEVSCPQPVGELESGSFICSQNFRCHGPSNLARCPEPEPPTNSLASSQPSETVFAVLAEWAAHTVRPSRVQALKGTPGMSSMFSFSSRLPPLLFITAPAFQGLSALVSRGPTSTDSNNVDQKPWGEIPKSSKNQHLNLLQASNYLYSISIASILGIISHLEMI